MKYNLYLVQILQYKDTPMGTPVGYPMNSFKWKPSLLMEAIAFINFVVFKDQLITISEYLHMSCAD